MVWYAWGWIGKNLAVSPVKNAKLKDYKKYFDIDDIGKTIFLTRKEALESIRKEQKGAKMTKEEIKNEIAECEEKLADLRKELDKPEYGGKRWKPAEWEKYYGFFPNGEIFYLPLNSKYGSEDYMYGNCFRTREEAEFEAKRRKVIAELSDYAEGDDAAWDGNTGHWQINYIFCFNYFSYEECYARKSEGLYFPSKEAAKAAVKAVGEERVKKYYLGVKEN